MQITDIETIPAEIHSQNNGNASVTFFLPEEHINAFILLLNSLESLFRGIAWKQKTDIDAIHARTDSQIAKVNERNEEYKNAVCRLFVEFVTAGNTPREALSLTVSQIYEDYSFSNYEIVRNCLTKNKLLKKTGFYAERHKYQ